MLLAPLKPSLRTISAQIAQPIAPHVREIVQESLLAEVASITGCLMMLFYNANHHAPQTNNMIGPFKSAPHAKLDNG